MSWIPGWSSVADAGWWSGFYFWASIACLIGLGITEVASHRYSERKDDLTAAEQRGIQRRHDEDMTRVQHDTAQAIERAAQLEKEAANARAAIANADARAAEATQKAAEAQLALERFKAPRAISPEDRERILSAIRPFSGQQYALSVAAGSEAEQFLCALDSILQEAKWVRIDAFGPITVDTECGAANVNTLSGVDVRVHPDSSKEIGGAQNATVVLAAALTSAGILTRAAGDPRNIPKPNVIHLMVGAKP